MALDYGSYEIPVTEYKIKSHQREISAEEKSMNKRANKEKKCNKNNNNTYHRPRSTITDMTGMENRCMAIKKKNSHFSTLISLENIYT